MSDPTVLFNAECSKCRTAQSILAARQFVPASRKVESPLNSIPVSLIDSGLILDQARKWQDLFQRTVISPPR